MTRYGEDDIHRANPDPIEERDRELGRAEFRDWDETREATRAGYDRRPEDIERDIERTRAHMDETLDSLQRKLSPGQLMDQALEYLRSGPGGFASNFGARVRDNPLPVAVTAIGLGWLMLAGSREDRERTRSGGRYGSLHDYGDEYATEYPEGRYRAGEDGRYATSYGEGMPEPGHTSQGAEAEEESGWSRAKQRAMEAGQRATEMTQGVKDRLGAVGHAARSRMSGMHSRSGGMMEGARYRAGDLRYRARSTAGRTREGFEHMLDEHPLVLGAVGLAVGAVLGAAIPSTRRERQVMGETRDEFMERAKEMGREEVQKVRRVAESAADAAQDAARTEADRQGLGATGQEGGSTGQDTTVGMTESGSEGKPSGRGSKSTGSKSATSTTAKVAADDRNTGGEGI